MGWWEDLWLNEVLPAGLENFAQDTYSRNGRCGRSLRAATWPTRWAWMA